MRIFGQIGRLKRDKITEYQSLHANVWKEVIQVIRACSIEDYSIFIHDDLVFSYFEYTGNDYEKDMALMEADEVTQRWWTYTRPCFEKCAFSADSEYYHDMRQIFYLGKENEK
ncbi:L-rhamnose mutarotase [uncultured Robinsoniella sp.]|uniref:L-rhamnose mutarotase n=1 Tax=uncultured Robinsoniella sp. TaxID=904190 RepID=UPI00374F5AC8